METVNVMLRKEVTTKVGGYVLPKDTILNGTVDLVTKKVSIEVRPSLSVLVNPNNYVICKHNDGTVNYHREPTKSEIKFGEGATHWLDIPESVCRKQNGDLKQWVMYQGERYYY